jgi:hypothetical protein
MKKKERRSNDAQHLSHHGTRNENNDVHKMMLKMTLKEIQRAEMTV